jgi:hypothetical protein
MNRNNLSRRQRGRSAIALIAAGGVAICVVGAAVWRYMTPLPPPAAVHPAASQLPIPVPDAGAPQTPDKTATRPSPGPEKKESLADVGELLKQRLPAAELIDHAESYMAQKQPGPAFLLLRSAARTGSGEAAFRVAQMYDPVGFSTRISAMPKPLPGKALHWYQEAKAAGFGESGDAQAALIAWLGAQANNGNEAAATLLEQTKR